ncbi:glucose-6-phosphate isomerase [Rhodoblastus sp.]|jgi:glucose-6-phosphate isomerase|uniref:glucose-6-phosphate isomerase n=1 Tax=Rhodoblastus sp. TaxID=1962975 RepID=UPI0025F309D2|nr:glucose-6-phosphate isomerase [Rhodoblastus sp.]
MKSDDIEAIWKQLAIERERTAHQPLVDLFAADEGRFEAFSARLDDLLLDFSKTALSKAALNLLLQLAEACKVEQRREAMFDGAPINITENRAVLHTALRNQTDHPVVVDGKDVMPGIRDELVRLGRFAEGVRSGLIKTARGQSFSDVIHIGIGGSDLGPVMTVQALAPYHDGPRLHFVSNVDGAHLADTIKNLDPARTLVIAASKTFTTIETMTNATAARDWLALALGETAAAAHLVALSNAVERAAEFGVAPDRIFGFGDWVGGRYSIWSSIGLPLMLAIGEARFKAFLSGAFAMDEHFRSAPLHENLPVLLGLIGIWHRNICGHPSRAILPYDQRLHRLPAYLQQLDMESNGKGVTLSGEPVARPTGPVIWGEPGTNGQHAFYQLLHQGTDVIPCEFIVAAQGHEAGLANHHLLLIANCLAQSEALMIGRSAGDAEAIHLAKTSDAGAARILAPHKAFPGNRPSTTIAYRKLDPYALGRLIALYEHRVFVEAAIFNINAFDQWGVELGKELATNLLPIVSGVESATGKDASTSGLVAHLRTLASPTPQNSLPTEVSPCP